MAEPITLNRIFQNSVARFGDRTALQYKKDREFQDISYKDVARQVYEFASGLAKMGVQKGDRVALLSENRPDWAITDLALLSLGAIVVPIYPTVPAPQVAYIVRNSGAQILICSDSKQRAKAKEARNDAPELTTLIAMDGDAEDGVRLFAEVVQAGREEPIGEAEYRERWQGVQPDDVASLVYTSGTTGDPKGAMLTHGNIGGNALNSIEHFRRCGEAITEDDVFLSFLPLCHVFERTTGYYLPLAVGATIAYCEGVRTIVDDMQAVRPTLMVCVPRVYEAMQQRIQDRVEKEGGKKRDIFQKAIEAGMEYADAQREGRSNGPIAQTQRLFFDKLVYAKIKDGFGGRIRFFVSGGAALNPETARFFFAVGLPIIEGYGMTETSPVMAVNPNRRPRLGTVGICIPEGELKIAEDGEICFRGPNVMTGYWNNEQATRDMIDADGWLHTGDVGIIDDEGYLKITDRKKDILVLVNGKKVAPQPIESAIKQSAFIDEAVLIGDKQNVVTALIIPNKSRMEEWGKEQNLMNGDLDALYARPEARKKIRQEIDAQSKHLADFEKVKRFTLLNTTFTPDSGELTPTLKVKRKVVSERYAREIAAMSGESSDG
ncbi:MAG: AMP-dependent synthetase/ligase [Armatimonadaceae bacterium]